MTRVPHTGELRSALLDWYARHRRDLPWRRTSDPYAVWVSEALLQQTRVEAARPYYERFLARFPTVAALAAADVDEVLALWSGLGYYRRARSLHAAARAIVARHGGRFPRSVEEARALPGVGPYTAGAVLSIAHDLPEPLVDGNVARVLARAFALEAPAGSAALAREAWSLARALVPPPSGDRARGPGAWNQALMELGALVCTPRAPRCLVCPWNGLCAARRAGRADELPRPAPRRAPVDVRLEVLLVEREGRVLLARRPAEGRMARLWELPTRERGTTSGLWPRSFPPALRLRAGAELGAVAHSVTHHRIRARVRAGELRAPAPAEGALLALPEELPALALTGMTRKVLRSALAAGRRPGQAVPSPR